MLVVVEVGVLNPGQQLVDTRSGRRIRIARRWEASRDIPGRTVDELNGHYAECRPSNRFARFGGGLNAVPHILNGDGEPLLLTGRDHNRYPLKGDYFSF